MVSDGETRNQSRLTSRPACVSGAGGMYRLLILYILVAKESYGGISARKSNFASQEIYEVYLDLTARYKAGKGCV